MTRCVADTGQCANGFVVFDGRGGSGGGGVVIVVAGGAGTSPTEARCMRAQEAQRKHSSVWVCMYVWRVGGVDARWRTDADASIGMR